MLGPLGCVQDGRCRSFCSPHTPWRGACPTPLMGPVMSLRQVQQMSRAAASRTPKPTASVGTTFNSCYLCSSMAIHTLPVDLGHKKAQLNSLKYICHGPAVSILTFPVLAPFLLLLSLPSRSLLLPFTGKPPAAHSSVLCELSR